MSDFRPMSECKGFNMERVLLKNKNGYMITAYFKDGMLQCDGDEDWTHPIAWSGFIRLRDLANGDNTGDSGLHLQRVMQSALPDTPDDEIYDAAAELYKAGKMLNATLLVKRHTTMNPAQAKQYCDSHFA